MSDTANLVERLRREADERTKDAAYPTAIMLLREAAAELERLSAALKAAEEYRREVAPNDTEFYGR